MNPDEPRESAAFTASTAALPEVLAFIASYGQQHQVPGHALSRLTLVVEELFLNSVLHGYHGEPGATVRLALHARPGEVELVLEDRAGAFDPFAALEGPAASSDPDARPVGKLGLVLVGAICRRRAYQRDGEINRVTVAIALDSPA